MVTKVVHPIFLILLISVVLIACSGGETGTGATDEQTVSVGRITNFGSVFVNGVEFNTDNSTFKIDDTSAIETNLNIGMVVTVQGTVNQDELTGDATNIEYKNTVKAIVGTNNVNADGLGILTVSGQTVVMDSLTSFNSGVQSIVTPDQITTGNVTEISGFTSGNGTIYATRVDVRSQIYNMGDVISIKGLASNAGATTFTVGGITVDYSSAQLQNISLGTISNGQFVEVKSVEGENMAGNFVASEVRFLGDGSLSLVNGTLIQLEGVVTTLVTPSQEFILNGQLVRLTDSTTFINGAASDIIESKTLVVKGSIDSNGIVVADNVLFVGTVSLSMDGIVESIDITNSTFILLGSTISIDVFTTMKDTREEDGLTLTELAAGDRLRVVVREIGLTSFIANKVERRDITNGRIEIEGRLDEINGNQLMIAGVNIDASAVDLSGMNLQVGDENIRARGTYDIPSKTFTATKVR